MAVKIRYLGEVIIREWHVIGKNAVYCNINSLHIGSDNS